MVDEAPSPERDRPRLRVRRFKVDVERARARIYLLRRGAAAEYAARMRSVSAPGDQRPGP